MWVEIKKTPNLTEAKKWQETFESEGIPARVMPVTGLPEGKESVPYKVLVPQDKRHIVDDILRKLA